MSRLITRRWSLAPPALFFSLLVAAFIWSPIDTPTNHARAQESAGPYSVGGASRDGIGKRFLGREIAKVMGHRGARWLERLEREAEEGTDQLVAALDLKPGDVVADIGAGTGYFSFRMAPLVARVLAVDIQPEMLNYVRFRMEERGVKNIEPIQGAVNDPSLPAASVDLVLIVDAYHEFSYPLEMLTGIVAALKPGGRLALAEYRAEDPTVPIKPLHKMTEAQAKAEMAFAGLRWIETKDHLPWQHLMFFEKGP